MSVDIELIKQRKSMYGDNFKCIGDKWNEHLREDSNCDMFDSQDIARMMSLMKDCRIEAIKEKLRVEVAKGEETTSKYMADLHTSLYDSEVDRNNYLWIADNWSEYEKL